MSEKIATRDAYGKAICELAEKDERIVVLDSDLSKSTRTEWFAAKFPDRFIQMGVAEQDMMGTAAGLAVSGKIPFASSFAVFATGRCWEQIRNSISYSGLNVTIAATHAGISVGEDGASHQSIEDIALMRAIPNMTVIVPADGIEAKEAVLASAKHQGPCYLRFGRAPAPVIFDKNHKFEIGKASLLKQGEDVLIVAAGFMITPSLEAAEKLSEEGIKASVVNLSTIKPIDREMLATQANICGCVVTAEEHVISGGLGSAVCEVLAEEYPVPVERIGIRDIFGQSGGVEDLFKEYGLTTENVVKTAKKVIKKKS